MRNKIAVVSKKVRELFGPPAKLAFAPPNPEMVKAAILMLHAQVKAAREAEATKGKATPHRRGEEPSS
jgi:hypothetical protein